LDLDPIKKLANGMSFGFNEEVNPRLLITVMVLILSQRILAQSSTEFSAELNYNLPKTVRVKIVNQDDEKSEIKIVNFEDYIAGVISKEMPLSWPIEALKAQAVVARNFALFKMGTRQNNSYDLRNDIWDQVFFPTTNSKALQAAKETRTVRLTDELGKTVKTFFHADCGGQTVPAWAVWPGSKSYGVAQDSFCKKRSRSQWSYTVDRAGFMVDTTNEKIKAQKFRSKWVSMAQLTMNEIRKTFGFDLIRSHPDEIKIDEDKIVFSGRGYGHGVGLCQWGAMEMARQGYTFKQILAHYYPKAFVEDSASRIAKQ
jgi:stage II sporulation protein D